jgi:hypothetical protein
LWPLRKKRGTLLEESAFFSLVRLVISELKAKVAVPVVAGPMQGRKIDGRVSYDVKARRELDLVKKVGSVTI